MLDILKVVGGVLFLLLLVILFAYTGIKSLINFARDGKIADLMWNLFFLFFVARLFIPEREARKEGGRGPTRVERWLVSAFWRTPTRCYVLWLLGAMGWVLYIVIRGDPNQSGERFLISLVAFFAALVLVAVRTTEREERPPDPPEQKQLA